MTGDLHAAATPPGLWPTLSNLDIGSRPDAFERSLADRNGWPESYACRVIGEYRRFIYLASIASFEVTPSKAVDEAWHLHLEDHADYRDALCRQTLGRELRHLPGGEGAGDEDRFQRQYQQTLALYASVFGAPPADIWPASEQREEQPLFPTTREAIAWSLALVASLACFFGYMLQSMAGQLLLPVAVAAVALAAWQSRGRRPRRSGRADGGSCGGGCSSGYDSCGDSSSGCDSAGCGGGCGGGD